MFPSLGQRLLRHMVQAELELLPLRYLTQQGQLMGNLAQMMPGQLPRSVQFHK